MCDFWPQFPFRGERTWPSLQLACHTVRSRSSQIHAHVVHIGAANTRQCKAGDENGDSHERATWAEDCWGKNSFDRIAHSEMVISSPRRIASVYSARHEILLEKIQPIASHSISVLRRKGGERWRLSCSLEALHRIASSNSSLRRVAHTQPCRQ